MKKAPAILLLILILYQLVGYYSIHQFQVYRVKKEVKKLVKNNIPQEQLTTIAISISEIDRIKWVKKDKEFIFEGEMYDVVKAIKAGNTITFYCIADFKETALFAKLDDYVNDFIASNPNKRKQNSHIFGRFQFEYLLQKQIVVTPKTTSNNKLNPFSEIQAYMAFLNIESPPPKFG